MVSGDFRQHPVGVFLEGVLAQMHPEHLELLAYSMNPQDDALTERIRPRFSKWMPIGKLSDESNNSQFGGYGLPSCRAGSQRWRNPWKHH